MTIKLIAGLGNPGPEYERSRHNCGRILLGKIASKYGVSLHSDTKFQGEVGTAIINNHKVWLLFPTTFMNLSGQSVSALANFYKISPEEILVLHDELDLPPGSVRLKSGGGTGGHNGLKSIVACLGNNEHFNRLRIGTGKPALKGDIVNFVLGIPPASEKALIDQVLDESLVSIDIIFSQSLERAMNRLNGFRAED